MTHKLLTYSDHALDQMALRGFTRSHVRSLLAAGLYEEAEQYGGERRHAKRGYLGTREARVIYIERQRELLVVTVEWADDPSTTEKKERGS